MNGMPDNIMIEITAFGPAVVIELSQGPESLLEDAERAAFPCDVELLPDWPPPEPVRSYGEGLFKRLDTVAASRVAEAVRSTLINNGTVYLKFKADQWERHAWEALHDNGGFFLLQPGRGLARIVDPRQDHGPLLFPIEQSLRVMAMLSAAGISAKPQWDALLEAARRNAESEDSLPIELSVLTGEEELVTRINNEKPVNDRLKIRVGPIVNTNAQTVADAITEFRPHLLHFFCHGQTKHGVGILRLADIDQHRRGMKDKAFAESEAGSFAFDFGTLHNIARTARAVKKRWLWMVVMNACKLGGGGANVSPLAQKLVAAGVPAAIGMTEEIDPIDAGEFCRGFYRPVFAEVGRLHGELTHPGARREIDWAKLLYGPRKGISASRHPASSNRQWTLPVLYLQSSTFLLERTQGADLARDIVNELAAKLQDTRASEHVIEGLRHPKTEP
jgi:CHAT domain